jgi:hypothetical protein
MSGWNEGAGEILLTGRFKPLTLPHADDLSFPFLHHGITKPWPEGPRVFPLPPSPGQGRESPPPLPLRLCGEGKFVFLACGFSVFQESG